MIKYTVEVHNNGDTFWFLGEDLHREDGPAIETARGNKKWYLNGVLLTEEEHARRTSAPESCDGKIVEIDGKRYRLQEV
jgi:hypothetical protein